MSWRRRTVETLAKTPQNAIETAACALLMAEPGASSSNFDKTLMAALWRWCAVSNDGETGKKRECAAIMIVFRRNPGVV
jgi:hypothetical protein